VEPHCISTDLTVPGRIRTVHSMTEMMTRFLAMGFTLDRVVEMCTINPARAIGEEARLGSLEVGKQADVSVLDIQDGDWVVYDVLGNGRQSERAVTPVLSVKRGEVYEAGWGPRPWGWAPDNA
jgi:dihydroorotase